MFLGFDRFVEENLATTAAPPHNVIKIDENKYVIELAVAGFSEDDLEIILKNDLLVVRGSRERLDRDYVYRGISTKKFRKSFRLAEGVNVDDVVYDNGILTINLGVLEPEEVEHKIEIKRIDNAKESI